MFPIISGEENMAADSAQAKPYVTSFQGKSNITSNDFLKIFRRFDKDGKFFSQNFTQTRIFLFSIWECLLIQIYTPQQSKFFEVSVAPCDVWSLIFGGLKASQTHLAKLQARKHTAKSGASLELSASSLPHGYTLIKPQGLGEKNCTQFFSQN